MGNKKDIAENMTEDVTENMAKQGFRHKTLEERAAEYDGKLMLDGEYDWGEPVGREVW